MSTQTKALLNRLLAGEMLSDDEQTTLSKKIEAFDDETAEALDELDAETIALALGDARASAPAEGAAAPVPSLRAVGGGRTSSGGASEWIRARTWIRVAAAGMALAASVALVTLLPRSPSSPDGIKGPNGPVQVRLIARIGARKNGMPVAGALLSSGAKVSKDAAVLFRYRLTAEAWGYLLAQGDGAPRLLYSSGHRRAGEHEVATDGQVMALFPSELGHSVNVVMVACSKPLDGFDWRSLPSIDAAGLPHASCELDGLLLRTEREQ